MAIQATYNKMSLVAGAACENPGVNIDGDFLQNRALFATHLDGSSTKTVTQSTVPGSAPNAELLSLKLDGDWHKSLVEAMAHQEGAPYSSGKVALLREAMPDEEWMINRDFFEKQRENELRTKALREGTKGMTVAEHAGLLAPDVWTKVKQDYESKVAEALNLYAMSPQARPEDFQAILQKSLAYQLMPVVPSTLKIQPKIVDGKRVIDAAGRADLELIPRLKFHHSSRQNNIEGLKDGGYRQMEITWNQQGRFKVGANNHESYIEYCVRVHSKTSDHLLTGLTTSVVTAECGKHALVLLLAPRNFFVNEYELTRRVVKGVVNRSGITFAQRIGGDQNAVWISKEAKDSLLPSKILKRLLVLEKALSETNVVANEQGARGGGDDEIKAQLARDEHHYAEMAHIILPPLHFTVPLELLGLDHPDLLSDTGKGVLGKIFSKELRS